MSKKRSPTNRPLKPSSIARRKGSDTIGSSKGTIQRKIDQIDREILTLINRRAEFILRLQQGHATTNDANEDMKPVKMAVTPRWEELSDVNAGPLQSETVRAVFREIHSGCWAVGHPPRIAYLGPAFTYSHLAAIEQFGQSVDLIPVRTISSVFEEVARGDAQYGLVPIDNSTDGRVIDTLVCLARSCLPPLQCVQSGPQHRDANNRTDQKKRKKGGQRDPGSDPNCDNERITICADVPFRVGHCLLGIGRRNQVKQVVSKPQALSQCRNWLATHLPDAHLIEVASTAEAASKAAKKRSIAAIASKQAGIHHGLSVLASHIEDNSDNVTRFVVLSRHPAKQTGDDKTSIVFEIGHHPGALADAMGIFKRNQLNLTWIESFPIPGSRGRYLFFVEFQGHSSDVGPKKALAALRKKALQLGVLGSYAQADTIV